MPKRHEQARGVAAVMEALHAAFHQRGTTAYRIVDGIVWALIALSLALFGLELSYGESSAVPGWLLDLDRVVLSFFVLELVLRVASCRPRALEVLTGRRTWRLRRHITARVRHLFTPMVMLDLLAVLALVPALRGLRALRLLRLLRGVRLFRYSSPFYGLLRSFQENALLYVATFGFLLVVINVAGLSFFLVEAGRNSDVNTVSDGIWWALVTLTTVGFGDVTPTTDVGRILGGAVMVLGMFTLALFAGIVGSTLLRVLVSLRKDQFRMSNYTNHIVICGYDPAAQLLLKAVLAEVDPEETELVVFGRGERPADLPPEFIWIEGDPSKESELDKVRMTHARVAVIIGSRQQPPQQADATTVLVTFTLRSYLAGHADKVRRRQPLYVVAEILDPENAQHAATAGADEVIETTRLGFSLIAHAALVPGSGTIMGQVASAGAHSLYIEPNPYDAPMAYGELSRELRQRYGTVVLGLRHPETGRIVMNPSDGHEVDPAWEVVYLGKERVFE